VRCLIVAPPVQPASQQYTGFSVFDGFLKEERREEGGGVRGGSFYRLKSFALLA